MERPSDATSNTWSASAGSLHRAVIDSAVAGLTAAHILARAHHVTLGRLLEAGADDTLTLGAFLDRAGCSSCFRAPFMTPVRVAVQPGGRPLRDAASAAR